MLRNELATTNQSWNMGGSSTGLNPFNEMGLETELTVDEMMDAFDVSLDIRTIGIFYVIGLSAVIVSTIVPVMYIVTLHPKKVLM
jgi:putative ABC transport system permease protein